MSRWFKHNLMILIGLVVLGAVYLPAILDHIAYSTRPFIFNDDVRIQVWPFERYNPHASNQYENDIIATYNLDSLFPVGIWAIYAGWARFIGDPRILSDFLPYITWIITLLMMGFAANRIAGKWAIWGAVVLCLSTDFLLNRMTGGLPRAFALPLATATILALIYNRPKWLAIITLIGAAFYPPSGFMAGLTLTIYALLPSGYTGADPDSSVYQRLLLVAVTALLSILLLLNPLLSGQKWGASVSPAMAMNEIPEAGPQGRHAHESPPYPALPAALTTGFQRIFKTTGPSWPGQEAITQHIGKKNLFNATMWAAFFLTLVGCIMAIQQVMTRRMLIYFVAALIAYQLAVWFAPYLYRPTRYMGYSLLPITFLLLPFVAAAAGKVTAQRLQQRWPEAVSVIIVVGTIIFLIGGRGEPRAGYYMPPDIKSPVYRFFANQPADVLVAGWPDREADNLPYLLNKSVFISRENHHALHVKYALEMRTRMYAFLDAYYATDIEPVLRLRNEYGVTHLVLNLYDFIRQPSYFAPFTNYIANKFSRNGLDKLVLLQDIYKEAVVLNQEEYVIVDLSRLPEVLPNTLD